MSDLIPYGEVLDGEIVDDTCQRCGDPGTWQIDPYAAEIENEEVMICLCGDCLQERYDAI
ncbi:hypothetical protein [Micromonospora sp. NPDC005174]|uniref:hypothetical protein n=1 Tax=Micromonospora sp. NPDC005174 TaxID=3157018 RepID=UPI00339FD230